MRDLDIAEEATADAFLLALQHWPASGVPASVEAWLITAAKRRAIDRIRRAGAARKALVTAAGGWTGVAAPADQVADAAVVGDDELRMVVLCCDPRITTDEQVALTLRLACGVSTAGIAAAYRVSRPTMAARITRAKAKLMRGGPALDLPDDETVDARLPVVCRVVHLAFSVGHTRTDGTELTDEDLADRAQYLAAVLRALRPRNSEFTALLALILLTRARAAGRFDMAGEQVLLADANRGSWDRVLMERGFALLDDAWELAQEPGPMALQAAIAAEHGRSPSFAATDWARIVHLYGRLLVFDPSPVTALGRCMAWSYLHGPAAGLVDLDDVLAVADLADYPYAHAARAQLLGRLGRDAESRADWERAAATARTDAERAHFVRSARTVRS